MQAKCGSGVNVGDRIMPEPGRYVNPNPILRRYHLKRFAAVMDIIKALNKFQYASEAVFIDVGCGDGTYEQALKGTFCHLVGLDLSLENLKTSRKLQKKREVDFVLADVEYLPLKDRSANIVLCSEVLEHVRNSHLALSELSRIFKDAMIVSVPTLNVIRKSRFLGLGKRLNQIELEVGHVNMHEPFWWAIAIEDAVKKRTKSFEIKTRPLYVTSEPVSSVFGKLDNSTVYALIDKSLNLLERLLARPLFANHLVISVTAF